jgi:hypothetical protein
MNAQTPPDDARGSEEIIAAALGPSCEPDSHAYWAEVRMLQHRIDLPLIDKMQKFIVHQDERHRMEASRIAAAKNSDEAWKPLLARCDELGLGKPSKQSSEGNCTP